MKKSASHCGADTIGTIYRIIKLVLSIFFWGLTAANRLLNRRDNGPMTVVTYHSVKGDEVARFAKQMDEVVKAGNPVLADIERPSRQNEHLIAVTFDDGFRSFVDYALPIMLEKGIPATVFVTTGYLGQHPGWVTSPEHRNFDESVMGVEEIANIVQENVLVGSHSVTHPRLGEVEADDAFDELTKSKSDLEKIIGKEVSLFSLPHGSYNEEIFGLSRKIGYNRVFLNVPRTASRNFDDSIMGRIDVRLNDWLLEYKLKFRGGYEWLGYANEIRKRLKETVRRRLR